MRNASMTFDIQSKKPTHGKIMVDYISTNNVCSINNIFSPINDYDICGEYCITKKPSMDDKANIIAAFAKNDTINYLIRMNLHLHTKDDKVRIEIEQPVNQIGVTTLKEDIFLNQINTLHVRDLEVSPKIARKIQKNLQDAFREYEYISDIHKVKVGKIKILHKEH